MNEWKTCRDGLILYPLDKNQLQKFLDKFKISLEYLKSKQTILIEFFWRFNGTELGHIVNKWLK